MAQFTIKWPNGAEVTFEGDVSFKDLEAFLDREEPPSALRGEPLAASASSSRDGVADVNGEEDKVVVSLDPQNVFDRFETVGARTDIERVTVIAFAAQEAGAPGIDIDTAQRLYRELGLRMPGVWRSTFSNAATRGYLVNEGRGVWRPTAAGENFARLGQRRPSATRRRRRASQDSQARGGDSD
jgi:hypothetical protein